MCERNIPKIDIETTGDITIDFYEFKNLQFFLLFWFNC